MNASFSRLSSTKRDTLRGRRMNRRPWSCERLEDRTLLATALSSDGFGLAAQPLAPVVVANGSIAAGGVQLFPINPTADSRLIAQVHASNVATRLALLDAQGRLIVQSDGQSATSPDD